LGASSPAYWRYLRKAILIGTGVVVAAVVVGFTVLGGSPARASRPTLHVVVSTPLTVRGEHFRSHERIHLSAGAKSARMKASTDGSFVITITGASRCDTSRLLARGSAGSYAVVKLLPSPQCLPARSH
jgi:hypothetical protein